LKKIKILLSNIGKFPDFEEIVTVNFGFLQNLKMYADAENLCKVFNLMDFQKTFSQQLQVSQMQTNQFLLNDINSYWVYDTLKQESGESDVFSDDDDEDFF